MALERKWLTAESHRSRSRTVEIARPPLSNAEDTANSGYSTPAAVFPLIPRFPEVRVPKIAVIPQLNVVAYVTPDQ